MRPSRWRSYNARVALPSRRFLGVVLVGAALVVALAATASKGSIGSSGAGVPLAARSTDALVFDIVPRLQSSVRQQCVDGREKATFAASLGIYRAGAVEVKLKHKRQSSVFGHQSTVSVGSLSR